MIVMHIEIDDGKDLVDIRATKYLKGDPFHPDALAFLAGDKMLIATSVGGVTFLGESELVAFAAELIGRHD